MSDEVINQGAPANASVFTAMWLIWGRRFFTSPKVQGTPEELRAIEQELEAYGS